MAIPDCDQSIHTFNGMQSTISNASYDRFIPHRTTRPELPYQPHCPTYSSLLRKNLFDPYEQRLMLNKPLSQQTEASERDAEVTLQDCHQSPIKILDLPNYRNDFYINGVDWSPSGLIAIALTHQVYLYSPTELISLCKAAPSLYVSAVKFDGELLGIGHSNGQVELYDLNKCKLIRTLNRHEERVAAIQFMNGKMLTGSKDRTILLHDLRQCERDCVVSTFKQHKGEVCSIQKQEDHGFVFASGSNDNSAIIWDLRQTRNYNRLKGHMGAVKAISWCPWKNGILATGGGSNDCCLRIWDTKANRLAGIRKVNSQISGLLWNEQAGCAISSHGYSRNQVNFWSLKYEGEAANLTLKKYFKAHTERVLSLGQSANQNQLYTVGADETLKFWPINMPLDQFSE